jgi:hypothetical protein
MLMVTVALGSSGLPSAVPSALLLLLLPGLLLLEHAAALSAITAANANAAAFLLRLADICVLPERNLTTIC